MHWREWFAKANAIAWQGVDVPESRVKVFSEEGRCNSTEAMYQAFKSRLLEELIEKLEEKKDVISPPT